MGTSDSGTPPAWRPYLPWLGIAFAISVALLPAHGTPDVDQFWLRWIELIQRHGVRTAYAAAASDYPPMAFLLLAAVARSAAIAAAGTHLTLKLSLWVALAIASVLFHWKSRRPALTIGFIAALTLSSVGLAYLDIYFVPFLVGALWALRERRFGLGLLLYSVACLIKFQPAIVAPAVLVYFYRAGQLRPKVVAPSLALAVAVWLAFGPAVAAALSRATGHTYLSAQALNFNWLIAFAINALFLNGALAGMPNVVASPVVLGALRLLFLGLYVVALVRVRPATFDAFLRTAIAGFAAYLAFAPAVHENHSMVLLVLLAVSAACGGAKSWEFFTVALMANLNLIVFDGLRGAGPSGPIVLWLAVAVLVAVGSTTMMVYLYATRTVSLAAGYRASAER